MNNVILTVTGLHGGLFDLVIMDGVEDDDKCNFCAFALGNDCIEHEEINQSMGDDCEIHKDAFWNEVLE